MKSWNSNCMKSTEQAEKKKRTNNKADFQFLLTHTYPTYKPAQAFSISKHKKELKMILPQKIAIRIGLSKS